MSKSGQKGFQSFIDGMSKGDKKNKQQKTETAAAEPDATVLFKPKQSGDADLLKLLSGNTNTDSTKKQKNDDENDRGRNQGLGAEKISGLDQLHNLKKGIDGQLSRKDKRKELNNQPGDKSSIIDHFRKEKHLSEKDRLINKRKMKMENKQKKRVEYQESQNKISGIEGIQKQKLDDKVTQASDKAAENLFNESKYTTPKELKYRTKDLNQNSSEPRIKTKTRSKQKNLRKDKRSDDLKMEKFGSILTGEAKKDDEEGPQMTNEEKMKIANLQQKYQQKQEPEEPQPEEVKVFMEVQIGSEIAGKMIIKLYTGKVPKTAENFRALCTGERGRMRNNRKLHFKGSPFHRVIPGFMAQGGDITTGDGRGGCSIYGETFRDENFIIKHQNRGDLSMANAGPNTNGSQFFLLFGKQSHLNGKHTVFGRVISGLEVLDKLEKMGNEGGKTRQKCIISNCGQIKE